MANLIGKVAIVTGSSRGIGRALAERLGRDGANVVVTYAGNREKAEAVVSTIKANGSDAIALPLDLTKLDDIRKLFQTTIEQFGKLDILVVSGGAPRLTKSIVETTEAEFDSVFTFNAKGNFFALQEAAKHMADNGRIVTFSTPYTVQPQPNLSVIAGSKAAIEAFTFALAKEVGARGIRVNAIMPGPTKTDSFSECSFRRAAGAAKTNGSAATPSRGRRYCQCGCLSWLAMMRLTSPDMSCTQPAA
jgi:3-oxoacyl-[acyl-carrier protein] reductase